MIPVGGVKELLTLSVKHDSDVDSPALDDGAWSIYSFSRRHNNYKSPEELGLGLELDKNRNPVIESEELRAKFERGHAFFLSYFEHGGCVWSIKGSGPQCRWDTAQNAGLLVWEHDESDMGAKTPEERRKDAEAFLQVYTAWCNGECYYFTLTDEEGEARSFGGFIGPDLAYMFEAIRAEVGNNDLVFKGGDLGSADDLRRAYEEAKSGDPMIIEES